MIWSPEHTEHHTLSHVERRNTYGHCVSRNDKKTQICGMCAFFEGLYACASWQSALQQRAGVTPATPDRVSRASVVARHVPNAVDRPHIVLDLLCIKAAQRR